MSDVTSEGKRLIRNWLNAATEVQRSREWLDRRENECAEAMMALAKWLLPDDAKPGEQIAVWFSDSLIQVRKGTGPSDRDSVCVRTRGKHFHELSLGD